MNYLLTVSLAGDDQRLPSVRRFVQAKVIDLDCKADAVAPECFVIKIEQAKALIIAKNRPDFSLPPPAIPVGDFHDALRLLSG